MCLTLHHNWKSLVKKKQPEYHYKVYVLNMVGGEKALSLRSPYQDIGLSVKRGSVIKSNRFNRQITDYELNCSSVSRGIHVYNNLKSARTSARQMSENTVILRVKGHGLVATNPDHGESVFMRISIHGAENTYTRYSVRSYPVPKRIKELLK